MIDSIDAEDDDDVKVFEPEIPSAEQVEDFDDGFDDVDLSDPVFDLNRDSEADFEIDFSMFEVDEEKKKAREAQRAELRSGKKKKKKKR